jgi:hypothetical protein
MTKNQVARRGQVMTAITPSSIPFAQASVLLK